MKRTEKKPSFRDWIRGWAGLLVCSLVLAPPSAYALKTQEVHEAAGFEELEQRLTARLEEKTDLAEAGLEEVPVLEISMGQFLEESGVQVRSLQEVDRDLLLGWLKQKIAGAPAGQQRVVRIQPATAEEVRFWLGLQLGFQSVWKWDRVRGKMNVGEFPPELLDSMKRLMPAEGSVSQGERVSLEIPDPSGPHHLKVLDRILFFPASGETFTAGVPQGVPDSFLVRLDRLAELPEGRKEKKVRDQLLSVLFGQLVEQVQAGSIVATPLILPEERAKEQFAQAVGLPPVEILSEAAALKMRQEQHNREQQGTASQRTEPSGRRGRKKTGGTAPLSTRQRLEQDPDFERMLNEYPELLAPAGQDRRAWYLELLSAHHVSQKNGWNPTKVIAFLESVRNVQRSIQNRLPGYPSIAGVLMIDKLVPRIFIPPSEPPRMVLQIDLTDLPASRGDSSEKDYAVAPSLLKIYGEALLQMDPGLQDALKRFGQPPEPTTMELALQRWLDQRMREQAEREAKGRSRRLGRWILEGGLKNHRWFHSEAALQSLDKELRVPPSLEPDLNLFVGASLAETTSLRTMFLLMPEAVLSNPAFWNQALGIAREQILESLDSVQKTVYVPGDATPSLRALRAGYYAFLDTFRSRGAFLAAARASIRVRRVEDLQALNGQLDELNGLLKNRLSQVLGAVQGLIVDLESQGRGSRRPPVLNWQDIYEKQRVQLNLLADSLKFRGEMGQPPGFTTVVMVSPQGGLEEPQASVSGLEIWRGDLPASLRGLVRVEEIPGLVRGVQESVATQSRIAILIDQNSLEPWQAGLDGDDFEIALIGMGGILKKNFHLPSEVDFRLGLLTVQNLKTYEGFRIIQMKRDAISAEKDLRMPFSLVPIAAARALAEGQPIYEVDVRSLDVRDRHWEDVVQDLEVLFAA